MNVRFVIGPTITPVVQNVTKIAAGVHLDFTKRYSRKLAREAPPTAATASMMEMGIAVAREEGLKPLANEPVRFDRLKYLGRWGDPSPNRGRKIEALCVPIQ